jgi:hypothetical protein
MLRSIFAISILALAIMLSFVQPSYSICKSSAECSMATDQSGQDDDGPYDPCDNNINWTFTLYRNGNTTSSTVVQWIISNQVGGTVAHLEKDSRYVDTYQWHSYSGTQYVGASTWHKLTLKKASGSGGHFSDLDITINYVADNPDRIGN